MGKEEERHGYLPAQVGAGTTVDSLMQKLQQILVSLHLEWPSRCRFGQFEKTLLAN